MAEHSDNSDNRSPASSRSLDRQPSGAARRRLLRALGGSSVALGTVLAAEWHKPIVKAIVLPVHAQMSPGDGDTDGGPIGCAITASVSIEPVSVGSFSVEVGVASTDGAVVGTLLSTSGASVAVTASGSSTLPTGFYQFGGDASVPNGEYSISSGFSCCDATESFTILVGPDETSQIGGLTFDVTDDGECEFTF